MFKIYLLLCGKCTNFKFFHFLVKNIAKKLAG